jgi:molybdate transport system regulatory protein
LGAVAEVPGKARTPSLNKPAAAKGKARAEALRPQLRISFKKSIAMGPGKADLLDAIGEAGSISAAARALGMSYRRAWLLVETMNECFRSPLVETATGGEHGGGAVVTNLGHEVVRRYRAMEKKAATSVSREMVDFSALLAER